MDEGTKDKWYLTLNYSETKDIIQEKLQNMSRDFVAIGYYLKWIRDNELYKQDGYSSIWEFAEDNYGIKRTTASRWMAMNDKFSEDGNTPILAKEFRMFGKSQLQEMLYLDDKQMEEVSPDMTVQEIREVRKPEPEGEPISILGYPLRVYPEDSLIKTPGCGKQDCFSCHRDGCELRQEDCYCVEAPMGNPFPCTTLNVVENLRQEVGSKCQFVNEDLAFHRAGDGQPVPCCKKCNHPCGYECNRSVQARYEVEKTQQEEMCDVAHESEEQIPGQMNVEDYPELLPAEEEPDADIDNDEDNVVDGQSEYATKNDETVIDAEHTEVSEDEKIPEPDERWSIGELPQVHDRYIRCLARVLVDAKGIQMVVSPGKYLSDESIEKRIKELDRQHGGCIHLGNGVTAYASQDIIEFFVGERDLGVCSYKRVATHARKVMDSWKPGQDAAENTENPQTCCENSSDLNYITFSQIAIRDYLEEEEQNLAEFVKCDQEEEGFPQRVLQKQQMLVKALRLLMENEADQDEQEDAGEPEEQEEPATVQPDLPVMKNNDQRKEWLKNYKEWGLWYRDENIDVNYYKYDFSDGSRLVVAEYPKRRMYWRPKEFADEHYYHLLDKNRKYYGSDKTFEQQYVHSADSETSLVEFLKNLQKGEKK